MFGPYRHRMPASGAMSTPAAAALGLRASCRDGCTEAIMLAHGFTIEQMVEIIRVGLATAQAERIVAGGLRIEIARIRITGHRALSGR
jgi:hypothetical protein